jgi:hypothetical protein
VVLRSDIATIKNAIVNKATGTRIVF